YNSIGSQRPYSWFKYFKEFELEPIIVTRDWDKNIMTPLDYIKPSKSKTFTCEELPEGLIYRAPFKPNIRDSFIIRYGFSRYKTIRKLLTFFILLTEYHISIFDSKQELFSLAKKVIEKHHISYIIATGEPFILFKYAHNLSKKFNIPWIADYRDCWSQNYTRSKIESLLFYHFEKKTLATSTRITTVSHEFAKRLSVLHNKSIDVIYNGFFEENFTEIQTQESQAVFTLSFAGTLYKYQPIEEIAEGIIDFCTKKNTIVNVCFVGLNFYPEQATRVKEAFNSNLINLEITERLNHISALQKLNKANILLLPSSPLFPQVYAKAFDYIALNKKILLFMPDNATLEMIIKDCDLGLICYTKNDISKQIEQEYENWKTNGNTKYISSAKQKYTRRIQTKKLTEIILSLPC
ncbi:MAG TPA: hypothetical protein PK029_03595, partial [Bacteroidales bacterium]|nr:hypothetical protein [Bacteroidales bacterium]